MVSNSGFQRSIFPVLLGRLTEQPRRIQILTGPRQVGKTTLVRQVLDQLDSPSHYASADEPALRDRAWLEAQWEVGRAMAAEGRGNVVLALDEIQKIADWAETVKRHWDEDRRANLRLHIVLTGSAALPIQHGSSESLTGRFEVLRLAQWSFMEMREAFDFSLEQFIFFGGYPGAADLIEDGPRWAAYVRDSILETTVSRDILQLSRVDKPALMRSLLRLVCDYNAQIISYQKLLGRLHDAGNTTTLAHYLDLFAGAGIAVGLERYSGSAARRRRSIPKLLVFDTGLVSASGGLSFDAARADRSHWGRLVETAVGAHLLNSSLSDPGREILYWRERNREVDFVIVEDSALTAVEVKSGRPRDAAGGLAAFEKAHGPARKLLIGGDGISIEQFLTSPVPASIALSS